MKRVILILTLLLLCITVPGQALEAPTKLFYAADYAQLLSKDTENFVIEHAAALEEATGAQVVVATVEDLQGRDVMDYALDLLRTWKVGSKDNNGVLILVSAKDRKIGVSVGYGLEGALNDAKVGRLIDTYAIPALRNNDFDTGIGQLYGAVLSEVYQEYHLEVPERVKSLTEYTSDTPKKKSGEPFVIVIILGVLIVISLFNRKNGPPPGSGGGGYYRRRGFYGGFFGTHGSGGFGSGGFGGFGGGGGSGGGGGASRGF